MSLFLKPLLDTFCAMNRMSVYNKIDFSSSLSGKAAQKFNKDVYPKTFLNTMKLRRPRFVIAEIILQPNRFPVPGMTGVRPRRP